MKKLLMLGCFAVLAIGLHAQNQQRQGGGQMGEMMKQKLKDDLKFSDVQVDSVMAIQMEFQMKNREVRMDDKMDDGAKKAKMDVFAAERKARLKNSLNDDQIQKLDAMYEEMRKMRQNRQGNN